MGKLIRYEDSKTGCWARVNLSNGDPILISIAQSGVMVKKSRLGFIGPKLYNENNVYNIAKNAQTLDSQIMKYTTPPEITNPVLRVFTQTALECTSAGELTIRLNNPGDCEVDKASKANEPGQQAKMRQQIISAYGSYIENHPMAVEIRDVSELPYPKEEILDTIIFEIVRVNDDQIREAMITCALLLADFQENVGSNHLTLLGISNEELTSALPNNGPVLKELSAKIADNPVKVRYEHFRKIADKELLAIQSKLVAAEALRRKLQKKNK